MLFVLFLRYGILKSFKNIFTFKNASVEWQKMNEKAFGLLGFGQMVLASRNIKNKYEKTIIQAKQYGTPAKYYFSSKSNN